MSARKPGASRSRVVTGLTAAITTLAATFYLPADLFFAACALTMAVVVAEYTKLVRGAVARAPYGLLLALVPAVATGGWLALRFEVDGPVGMWLLLGWLITVVVAAVPPLLGRTPMRDAPAAIGLFAFAIPYFALPTIAVAWLKAFDPWLLFVLFTIVWLGDVAAYYVGSLIGRHKMAPRISPNKSWEGAVAGLLASVGGTAVWSLLRLDRLDLGLLALAAFVAVAGQLGDLLESAIKRGVGAKDSSHLLPGHGGMFDRVDALLLAAPVFLVGLWSMGLERFSP